MQIFISTQMKVLVPSGTNIVITPRFRTVVNQTEELQVYQHGILSPDCSPLGWYQSIAKLLMECLTECKKGCKKESCQNLDTIIKFDSELPVQGIGGLPPHDDSGIFKVDQLTVKEFTSKYPFSKNSIESYGYGFNDVGLKTLLEDLSCSDDDLYIARYAPNIAGRIISKHNLEKV